MSEASVDTPQKTAATAQADKGVMVQRKCACGQHTVAGGECESCRKKRLKLQRWDKNHAGPALLTAVPAAAAGAMTPRFGVDFTHVQLRTPQPMIQRQPRGEAAAMPDETAVSPAETALTAEPASDPAVEPAMTEAVPGETAVPGLLVEDETTDLGEGQMRKSEFLAELKTAVCAAADAELAATGRNSEGCPYLDYWFDYYSQRDVTHGERVLYRYAPEAANATSARAYIPIVAERVRQGVARWARAGEISGVPEGMPTTVPGEPSAAGGNGSVQLKERAGGGRPDEDPAAIRDQLGNGRPLDSGVRSRMESAFGTSFSHVRMHNDSNAADLSSSQNARAFTVGEHVAFGAGEYQPGTMLGDALIAHELAHVVQQGGAADSVANMQVGDVGYDALEKDADQTAVGIMSSIWGNAQADLKNIAQSTVPQLRSGLRLQRCNNSNSSSTTGSSATGTGTATTPTVDFDKFATCSAFDDTITPHALMVPKSGTNKANAVINPNSAASNITFESLDTGKATVSPATASGTPQTITVTGVAKGETEIVAKRTGSTAVLSRLKISIKDRLTKTAEIHKITETRNTPNLVPTNVPAAGTLQTFLNDQMWGKQANVFFTITRTDHNVGYDLDGNRKMADPQLVSATDAEINAISAAAKSTSVDFNMYFVKEMEVPTAFTIVSRSEIWLQDTHLPTTDAHELGHAMGRSGESTDSRDLMFGSTSATKCEIRKRDWDIVNP